MTNNDISKGELQLWIEPAIETLDLDETNALGGPGPDGGNYADCSRS